MFVGIYHDLSFKRGYNSNYCSFRWTTGPPKQRNTQTEQKKNDFDTKLSLNKIEKSLNNFSKIVTK